jgi:hypothetical protein
MTTFSIPIINFPPERSIFIQSDITQTVIYRQDYYTTNKYMILSTARSYHMQFPHVKLSKS